MHTLNCGGGMTRRTLIGSAGSGLALSLVPSAAHAKDDLDTFVSDRMKSAGIPGLALGIAQSGKVVSARGYGLADVEKRRRVTPDTMFHIASITKTITAMTIMVLVEQGLVVLDEPVAPHLDFVIAGENAALITFRHLLMHTAGISDEVYYEIDFRQRGADATLTIEQLLRSYLVEGGQYTGAGNIKHVPGTRWEYSNVGYALLGYLAGRIAGTDMRKFTQARLFRPLGLQHISWTIANTPQTLRATPYDLVDGALKPVETVGFPDWSAGMIRASVSDLTLLVAAAANGGATDRVRLIGATSNAEMMVMDKPAGLPDWYTGQGLGWQQSVLDGVARINHWGGDPGVFTMAYLKPEQQRAVVILSNFSATADSRAALKAIAARVLDGSDT